MAVLNDKAFTPQEYVDRLVGKGEYTLPGKNSIEEIQHVLNENGYGTVWGHHALTEIELIVEADLNVVLVNGFIPDPDNGAIIPVSRLYEVPTFLKNEFKK